MEIRAIAKSIVLCCLCYPAVASTHTEQHMNRFVRAYEENIRSVYKLEVTKNPSASEDTFAFEPEDIESIENKRLREFLSEYFRKQSDQSVNRLIGTAIAVSENGLLITAAHLIRNATEILVSSRQFKKAKASVIYADNNTDIALIRLDDTKRLQPPVFGNPENLEIGASVATIGMPFGFEYSLSSGIVSHLDRQIPGIFSTGLIQTDLAANPGNSGGPLINAQGEIVGMITKIFSKSGANQGITFALPIYSIDEIINAQEYSARRR